MEIKPTLFIGSSREGLPIARIIKNCLSDFADCVIWDEPGVFPVNEGYLNALNGALSFYEYGIMVATADDQIVSRNEAFTSARDNILFEFGLFLGRLGKHKTFLVKEKGIKTPSDLQGVTIPEFSRENSSNLEAQIANCCSAIVLHIESRSGIFDGGMYPSIPLAYGYFTNSLLPACKHLRSTKTVRANGKAMQLDSFQFHILIPDDLRDDMKEKVSIKKSDHNWIQLEIPTDLTRSYNFYILESDWGNTHLDIYDIPTTLNSLFQTIKEFAGSTSLGRSMQQATVERREIRYFTKVVEYLIEENSNTRNLINTEIVDI